MATRQIIVCDRCGRQMEKSERHAVTSQSPGGHALRAKEYCPGCYDTVEALLDQATPAKHLRNPDAPK